jgi:CheY-like chemotaxis protein
MKTEGGALADNGIQKVLMVDDDPNIRRIAEISLKKLTPWQVRVVASGQEALDVTATDCPDLVLLDMMMPNMDGMTVLAHLKENLGATMPKVILMTAKVQAHELDEYKQLGAAGVISKPFDPMTLPSVIRAILDGP